MPESLRATDDVYQEECPNVGGFNGQQFASFGSLSGHRMQSSERIYSYWTSRFNRLFEVGNGCD